MGRWFIGLLGLSVYWFIGLLVYWFIRCPPEPVEGHYKITIPNPNNLMIKKIK
jgi:hypothetical protein